MIPVKLNGTKYNFPTQLNEITLGQWLRLRKSTGAIEDLSILTGLNAKAISNFKSVDDFRKCQVLIQTLLAGYEKEAKSAKMPKSVQLGGKTIVVPKKLELEPVGAYISVHNLIANEYNTYEANGNQFSDDGIYADILSYYFWLPYNGDGAVYNDEQAEAPEYKNMILQLPFLDAITIGNFFFQKFPDL
jgi:hypothetical protein